MSDSAWPHRQQPTRLSRPWDSPGKNTGVGCHCLLRNLEYKCWFLDWLAQVSILDLSPPAPYEFKQCLQTPPYTAQVPLLGKRHINLMVLPASFAFSKDHSQANWLSTQPEVTRYWLSSMLQIWPGWTLMKHQIRTKLKMRWNTLKQFISMEQGEGGGREWERERRDDQKILREREEMKK